MLGVRKLHAALEPATCGTICTRSMYSTEVAGGLWCPALNAEGYKQTTLRKKLLDVGFEAFGGTRSLGGGCLPRVVSESAFLGKQVVVAGRASLAGKRKGLHQGRVEAFAKNPPAVETATDSPVLRTLWPSSASHKQGYVKVSELHTLYYEVFGNKNGKPAVFLHGGPGAGCSPNHSRFFDPERYCIVLFDQRGCGKSTPRGCLEENDTWALVEDLEKLRTELDIDKWLVVGGSWGTTLALAYAQTHPQSVSAMVLRAVCMMRQREIDWFYKQGADALFPFAWDHYVAHIPEEERGDLLRAYYQRLTSDDRQIAAAAARSWLRWEMSLLSFSNVPVVYSWDGKEYKSLPMPVAAASPASDPTPTNGPSPASSSAVSSGVSAEPSAVSAQPPTSPSSNGSAPGEAGVKELVTKTTQEVETAATSQEQISSTERNGNGKGDIGEGVTAVSASNGEAQAGSRTDGVAESETGNGVENGNGTESESKSETGTGNETRNETGNGSGNGEGSGNETGIQIQTGAEAESVNGLENVNGNGNGNGKETENGGVQEGTAKGTEAAAAAKPDELGVGGISSAETLRGGDWVSSSLVQARLESHYSINKAFFSEDQLLKGVDRIRKIPTIAIQGRYDFVCPMKTAFDLHSAWPEMELRVVPNAGHSQYEPGITHEIIAATDKFKDLDY